MSFLLTTLLATAAINPVIGDTSWVVRYGEPPALDAPERERIEVHLAYVEVLLRARDVSHLDADTRANRLRALDELAAYRRAGVFPRRTDDPYPGRRPRFIDDRGVHCAVGHLIAKLGAPSIAAEIDARQEYAYVADIDSPALIAWASDFGLTLRELAMIQPEYDAVPTAESTKEQIRRAVDPITLECAREHPIVPSISLHIRGDRSGAATATTELAAPFAQCFARRASEVERGTGAYDEPVIPYETDLTVRIPEPAQLLRRAVAAIRIGGEEYYHHCAPRPGPLSRAATLTAEMRERGLAISVATRPSNPEIDACLLEYLGRVLHQFQPSIWRAFVSVDLAIEPVLTRRALEAVLPASVRSAAQACGGIPAGLTVTVHARIARPLAVDIDGASDEFRPCFLRHVVPLLEARFLVPHRRPDGSYEGQFLADADADATYRTRPR